jgi:hypothetical protein
MDDQPAPLVSRRLNSELCEFFHTFVNPEDEQILVKFASVWPQMPLKIRKIGRLHARKAFSELKRDRGFKSTRFLPSSISKCNFRYFNHFNAIKSSALTI